MLTKEILDNIKEIEEQLSEKNDAVKATKDVALQVIEKVQEQFKKFGSTQSVDDKLKILAESSQECVRIVEEFHNDLESEVDKLKLKIETLEQLLDRVKKFEKDAGEQNVSIVDEGEKKGGGDDF